MALFTVDPSNGSDLYSDLVGAGSPSSGDDLEITRGWNEYTAGLTFTANNWGDVLVGQGFRGKIGAAGNAWELQANTSGKSVFVLGGRQVFLSCAGSTIARLVVDMADPTALVNLSGSSGGTMGVVHLGRGAIEVADSIPTLSTVYVEAGGRPKIRGSSGASAMGDLIVRAGGVADLERDCNTFTVDGGAMLTITDELVAPADDCVVSGTLRVREFGGMAATKGFTLNEGAVLDLSDLVTAMDLVNLTLGDNCRVIQRHGGPGYAVSGTTTTRGRGALVEYVTR